MSLDSDERHAFIGVSLETQVNGSEFLHDYFDDGTDDDEDGTESCCTDSDNDNGYHDVDSDDDDDDDADNEVGDGTSTSLLRKQRQTLARKRQAKRGPTGFIAAAENPPTSLCKRILVGAIVGAVMGLLLSFCVILVVKMREEQLNGEGNLDGGGATKSHGWRQDCVSTGCLRASLWGSAFTGVQTYLELFGKRWRHRTSRSVGLEVVSNDDFDMDMDIDENGQAINDDHKRRRLQGVSIKNDLFEKGPLLVVAGKMIINGVQSNIGEMSLSKKVWSQNDQIQLTLYRSYSGSEVYSILANHTVVTTKKKYVSVVGWFELVIVEESRLSPRTFVLCSSSIGFLDGV